MVLVKKKNVKREIVSKRRVIATSSLAVLLLIAPIVFIFIDPISFVAKYRLRLDNGTLLNKMLMRRLEGPRVAMFLFNITNPEEFLSGIDDKVKLEEIGPFVFQEYRTLEDMEINKDPGVMTYTPKLEPVFIAEESNGTLEDIYVTVPNMAMLSATSLVSKYPYVIRQIFNMIAASTHSKPFIKMRAYDYLWGYPDPLINMANAAVPGLIHFKSFGLIKNFYDMGADYRLELGTSDEDKFRIKKVTRLRNNKKNSATDLIDNVQVFKDAYEGAAFPPGMSPDMPISIYRHSMCKTFKLERVGYRDMEYGGRGFLYHVHNSTFNDHELCFSTGLCPGGLDNMSPCYFGLPVTLTKGHFLDCDPRLFDKIDGLKTDRKLHDTEIIIDPKIGVGIQGRMSLQLNLFLADVEYNPETRRLKDIVLPVTHVVVTQPRMLEEVKTALHIMYTKGPNILLSSQLLLVLIGLLLLGYSSKMMYWNWVARRKLASAILETGKAKAEWPLLNE